MLKPLILLCLLALSKAEYLDDEELFMDERAANADEEAFKMEHERSADYDDNFKDYNYGYFKGGGGGGGGDDCLALDTVVTTMTGEKTLAELSIGERILVAEPSTGAVFFTEYYTDGHTDPEKTINMLKFTTASGKVLKISRDHLIFTADAPEGKLAGQVRVGEQLIGLQTGQITQDEVQGIEPIQEKGFAHPLTTSGSLLVNGLLASSYSMPPSHVMDTHLLNHEVIHNHFSPLRLMYSAVKAVGRFNVLSGDNGSIHWWSCFLVGLDKAVPTILDVGGPNFPLIA